MNKKGSVQVQWKPMREKNPEVKSFALSRLMAGQTYRQVQDAIQETFGESVAVGTLNLWAHEDPEQAQAISQAHLSAIGHQRVRIAHKAGEMVEEAIDNGEIPAGQKAIVYGVASDKLDSMLKITQDDKKQNSQVETIRAELRKKHPSELKAMLQERIAEPVPPKDAPTVTDVRRYHALDSDIPGQD